MTTTTQQFPSNPALDFAQSILDVTNNGLELIEILRDIAEDDENANTNDRIAAANSLMDRAYGKPPKQLYPSPDPAPETEPERDSESAESNNRANHSSDTPHSGPESPRPVTRINDALNDTLGPAPTAQNSLSLKGEGWGEGEKSAFDPNSIHFTIQQHILDITNNGQTLRDALLKIARACPEPVEACPEQSRRGAEDRPRITSYHRRRAAGILVDRVLGTDSTHVLRAVQERPELVLSDEDYPDYPPGYVFDPTKGCIYCSQSIALPEGHEGEHLIDYEGLTKTFEDVQRMLDEQGITPDLSMDWNISAPSKKWIAHNIDVIREVAAKFDEELTLRIERQKAWPAVEERRQKKLAQMYPSHSEDQDDGEEPPDP